MYRSRISASRSQPAGADRGRRNPRRWQAAGVAALAVATVGVGLGVASAAETVPTVNCPRVAGALPAVPSSAQAEVERNLALLNTQIAEANERLRTSVGQGGPNFVQNAILGPLNDKRTAVINRIQTAIGRTAARPNLNVAGFSGCTLNSGGGASALESTAVRVADPAAAAAAVPTVNCPRVAGALPAVPASAQAEVERNLALLNTQIAEANNRLVTSVGQGGPNFVQNAILGPLNGKRTAVINRIQTAIGRTAARPNLNVSSFAGCTLNQPGVASAFEATAVRVADAAAVAAAVGIISCPDVARSVAAVPESARAEVDSNLALLNTQIAEANERLRTSVGQGGPNFVQNAILGPLNDKRVAVINRIATAIGRTAARPNLAVASLAGCTLQK